MTAAKQKISLELDQEEGLTTALINGTKIEVAANGDVTVYSSEGVQAVPAHEAATAEGTLIDVSRDFNTVAIGSALVRQVEGNFVIATKGTLTVKAVPAKAAPAAAPEALKVGTLMEDGTVYGGISPENGKKMFVTPDNVKGRRNKDRRLMFNTAAKRAYDVTDANGQKGFRIPTIREQEVLYRNRNEGALQGTFNPEGEYFSSTPDYSGHSININFGNGHRKSFGADRAFVRYVR